MHFASRTPTHPDPSQLVNGCSLWFCAVWANSSQPQLVSAVEVRLYGLYGLLKCFTSNALLCSPCTKHSHPAPERSPPVAFCSDFSSISQSKVSGILWFGPLNIHGNPNAVLSHLWVWAGSVICFLPCAQTASPRSPPPPPPPPQKDFGVTPRRMWPLLIQTGALLADGAGGPIWTSLLRTRACSSKWSPPQTHGPPPACYRSARRMGVCGPNHCSDAGQSHARIHARTQEGSAHLRTGLFNVFYSTNRIWFVPCHFDEHATVRQVHV